MRRFALVAVASIAGFGVAAACTDPYAAEDTLPSSTEGGVDAVAESTTDPVDGTTSFVDVLEPDVQPPIDATTEKPAVDAAGCFCDCDKDGYRTAAQDAAGCDASTTLFDCDDLDPRAHPDAGFVRDQPTVDTKGDWNCDGLLNREIAAVNVSCASRLVTSGCGIEGFVGDPGCGAKGTYVKCKSSLGTSCENDSLSERTQGCR